VFHVEQRPSPRPCLIDSRRTTVQIAFVLPSLAAELESELLELRQRASLRSPHPIHGRSRIQPTLSTTQPLVSFSSNDYLGLASDPRLFAEAAAAFSTSGFGAAASRLVSGSFPEHHALEAELAAFLNLPSALLFPSGYQANIGVITALAGPADLIVADRLVHASLIDAFRLSRAKLAFYKHLDLDQAAHHLTRLGPSHRRRFLVTESLFSMDGDIAPLSALANLAAEHDAALVVDEAHAFGTLGPSGRGLCAQLGCRPDVFIATLGKAFGASGAFIAGSSSLCSVLANKARSFIYTTAAPPPVAAAARGALRIIASNEGDQLRLALSARASRLRAGLALPFDPSPISTPIVPLVLGDNAAALAAAATLRASGYLLQAIRPPTVPPGQARLRITLSAHHTDQHIDGLLAALATVLPKATSPSSKATPTRNISVPLLRPRTGLTLLGTDTGVGKTSVACGLLHILHQRGRRPVPFKPVETGADPSPADAVALCAAAQRPDLPLDVVCPFRAKMPVAPAAAFSEESAPTPSRLRERAAFAASHGDLLLVETAGGLLSPYCGSFTAADLAADLGLPVLLVARNSLGTISHTALAIAELRRRALPLLGLVLVNTSAESSPDQPTNAALIALQTGLAPMGTLPYVGTSREPAVLAAALESALDLEPIFAALST